MEIDFIKCESELQRSATCGVKSKTYRAASFPSKHRRGMSQPKRQIAARRAANNERRKQDGHSEHVFTLKWKSCTSLPPRYIVSLKLSNSGATHSQQPYRELAPWPSPISLSHIYPQPTSHHPAARKSGHLPWKPPLHHPHPHNPVPSNIPALNTTLTQAC